VRRETGKPLTGHLHYAFGETGNWKIIDKKTSFMVLVRRETGKPLTGNLRYAFGETENWEPNFITKELMGV
jgi:hypothetical protein